MPCRKVSYLSGELSGQVRKMPQGEVEMTPKREKPPRKPNLVLILSDDMGFSDLGCYGAEIKTPHLDSMAGGGLRFTQMYNCARCCPSRASLLTGLYPHQAGIGLMVRNMGIGVPAR